MSSYKLSYLDLRGRGELIRYIFLVAGQDFEDFRFSYDEWYANIKATTPFGQVPVLEVDGKTLAQCNAIARYLAREFNLAGKDSWEQALCDQYMELADDFLQELYVVYYEKDPKKKAAINNNILEVICPKFLGFFEKALENNGGEYMVGTGVTVADLAVCFAFDISLQDKATLLDPYPKVKAHRARIEALPGLSEYVKNRKPAVI